MAQTTQVVAVRFGLAGDIDEVLEDIGNDG